jgi:hypothetical protein
LMETGRTGVSQPSRHVGVGVGVGVCVTLCNLLVFMDEPAETVKGRRELGIPIPFTNFTCSAPSRRSMSRLLACCATHAPVGLGVTPANRPPGAVLDEEQHIQTGMSTGVDMEESTARSRWPELQKLTPIRSGDGSMPASLRIFHTLDGAMRCPRPASSPQSPTSDCPPPIGSPGDGPPWTGNRLNDDMIARSAHNSRGSSDAAAASRRLWPHRNGRAVRGSRMRAAG